MYHFLLLLSVCLGWHCPYATVLPKEAPRCLECLKLANPGKGWCLCPPEGRSWRAGEKRLTLCDNLLYILRGFLKLSHLHLDGVSPHGLLQKKSVFQVGVHKVLGPIPGGQSSPCVAPAPLCFRDALPRVVGAARDG